MPESGECRRHIWRRIKLSALYAVICQWPSVGHQSLMTTDMANMSMFSAIKVRKLTCAVPKYMNSILSHCSVYHMVESEPSHYIIQCNSFLAKGPNLDSGLLRV